MKILAKNYETTASTVQLIFFHLPGASFANEKSSSFLCSLPSGDMFKRTSCCASFCSALRIKLAVTGGGTEGSSTSDAYWSCCRERPAVWKRDGWKGEPIEEDVGLVFPKVREDFPTCGFFAAMCQFLSALEVCSSKMDLFMLDPICIFPAEEEHYDLVDNTCGFEMLKVINLKPTPGTCLWSES